MSPKDAISFHAILSVYVHWECILNTKGRNNLSSCMYWHRSFVRKRVCWTAMHFPPSAFLAPYLCNHCTYSLSLQIFITIWWHLSGIIKKCLLLFQKNRLWRRGSFMHSQEQSSGRSPIVNDGQQQIKSLRVCMGKYPIKSCENHHPKGLMASSP